MHHLGQRVLAMAVALLLICTSITVAPPAASADPADDAQAKVDAAQSTYDEAQARLNEINGEYQQLTDEVNALQKKIDKTSASAMKAQQAVLEGRESLGEVAANDYRDGTTVNLITMLLNSESFDDLLRNVEYVNQIMAYQADEIAAQKKRKAHFDEVSEQLNAEKNSQEQALRTQEEKLAEAEAVVSEASASLDSAKADQAAQIAALEEQKRKLEEQAKAAEEEANPEQDEVSDSTTKNRPDTVAEQAEKEGNVDKGTKKEQSSQTKKPASSSGSSDSNDSDKGTDSGNGWKTGTASAYGGSSDKSTKNPGRTSTGAVCDDNSMGVAVPMSLSGYRKLYGRTVEIVYNGRTVYATVNDCGGLGGGSRCLDLQPGVFKAFGFKTCQAWGLRTVKYRFL